jgi:hypothetical protein
VGSRGADESIDLGACGLAAHGVAAHGARLTGR